MPAVARLVSAFVGFAAVFLAVAVAAEDANPIPPEPFFKHDDYGELKLSPSGKYIGALVPVQGRVRLAVIDLETKASLVAAAMDGDDIDTFYWVNDGRLVFTVMDLQAGLGEQHGEGLFAVNRDGTDFRILAPTLKAQENRWQRVYRYTQLQMLLRDGSSDILVRTNESNAKLPDVYRMDTMTGRKTLKTYGKPGDVDYWLPDRNGAVRAAVTDEKSMARRVFWRPAEEAQWVRLAEFRTGESGFTPIGFDGDGTLIVMSNIGRNTMAIYRYDTAKMSLGEELAAHPQADLVGGLVFDRRKNRVVGLEYDGPWPGAAWFDADWARIQKTVDDALPGRMNELQRADSGSRALVDSYSDTDPGSYYLLDLEKLRLEFVAARRKAVKAESMPERKPIRYKSRDGLEIPGYLTLPKGKEAKKLPLVLVVHGGPWVRGAHWRWSAEPAYLAALGYAVLEPEFRGSTGWGKKLQGAGWKQWGRGMQDDLNDGVDWLAKEGTIDPKRVCIMGASYGGYAVMMGLARDPERWRCGVNYVGVTDINLMFDVTWSDYAYSDYIKYAAKDMIGDPDKDAAMLKAASPLENAAKIKAPVLMAYGGMDHRVPIVHGEKMRDALAKQGTPVEWIVYQEEGHGFLLEKNRFDFYNRVAKFLQANNPPN
jgi:dipeptidyl aminopeptidase/acylaminoacyl peptidase